MVEAGEGRLLLPCERADTFGALSLLHLVDDVKGWGHPACASWSLERNCFLSYMLWEGTEELVTGQLCREPGGYSNDLS